MRFARVVGSASATVERGGLRAHKLLVVEPVDPHGEATGAPEAATDEVGAGIGDWVLLATGSAARQPAGTRGVATDCCAVAIVDEISVGGSTTYHAEGQ